MSYHLMPVYLEPGLVDGITPELKRRMRGKSCFTFTRPEPALFQELAALTRAGYDLYAERGLLGEGSGRDDA